VEKLGSMTPEQLEEIPGIGPKLVEKIQIAVNNYYSQFEEVLEQEPGAASPEAEDGQVQEPPAEDSTEFAGSSAELPAQEAAPGAGTEDADSPEALPQAEAQPSGAALPDENSTADSPAAAGEFDTIKDAG
jgi:N utilization substance protein A